jgi:hypothetical protein
VSCECSVNDVYAMFMLCGYFKKRRNTGAAHMRYRREGQRVAPVPRVAGAETGGCSPRHWHAGRDGAWHSSGGRDADVALSWRRICMRCLCAGLAAPERCLKESPSRQNTQHPRRSLDLLVCHGNTLRGGYPLKKRRNTGAAHTTGGKRSSGSASHSRAAARATLQLR